MDGLARRMMLAGAVIAVGGVAIALSGAGVGEGAGWKGTIVVLLGLGMVLHGFLRGRSAPPE